LTFIVLAFIISEERYIMRGENIRKALSHDAGAYARCSYCGKYSDNPESLLYREAIKCDCGKTGGWTGSFVKPDEKSEWSNNA